MLCIQMRLAGSKSVHRKRLICIWEVSTGNASFVHLIEDSSKSCSLSSSSNPILSLTLDVLHHLHFGICRLLKYGQTAVLTSASLLRCVYFLFLGAHVREGVPAWLLISKGSALSLKEYGLGVSSLLKILSNAHLTSLHLLLHWFFRFGASKWTGTWTAPMCWAKILLSRAECGPLSAS